MVSVMLEGSLVHPLVYRGLQFPFLPEHIQRYGRVLLGAEPGALKVSGSRPDLLRTCATFLPYHRFNLRRRVEHSAAGLNFSQLAAMRLYLETSVVETDLERLKRGHRDACPDSPDDALWGYLTTTEPPRSDPSYAAATSALAREYDRVEDLIEEQRS